MLIIPRWWTGQTQRIMTNSRPDLPEILQSGLRHGRIQRVGLHHVDVRTPISAYVFRLLALLFVLTSSSGALARLADGPDLGPVRCSELAASDGEVINDDGPCELSEVSAEDSSEADEPVAPSHGPGGLDMVRVWVLGQTDMISQSRPAVLLPPPNGC